MFWNPFVLFQVDALSGDNNVYAQWRNDIEPKGGEIKRSPNVNYCMSAPAEFFPNFVILLTMNKKQQTVQPKWLRHLSD